MLAEQTTEVTEVVPRRVTAVMVGLLIVIGVNAVLIGLFFDKAWIPSDDGHYVHVADRLADGQVLNAEVEELHPGYVHFIHAWSLKLFGNQVVSLRYPLMALMAAQSLVTYALFRRAGTVAAVTAAVTMSAIGTLQIANPTTSLYALGATVGLVGLLQRTTPQTRHRAVAIGIALGLIFLFRQLTAVFVAIGVFAFLFTEPHPAPDEVEAESTVAAQAVLALSLVGLIGYLATSTDLSATILFGLFPILILGWSIGHTTIGNRSLVVLLSRIAGGALLAGLPLIGYHLANRSLGAWIRDVFVRSLSIGDLEHITVGSYMGDLVVTAVGNLLFGSMAERLNAIYWIALVFAAFALGLRLVLRLRRHTGPGVPASAALPLIAVFYALVSVFNQIPYYLYLTAGLSIIGWLSMSAANPESRPRVERVYTFVIVLGLIGVVFHAGQPYTRTYPELVGGQRIDLVQSDLPHLGLWIDPDEEERYRELLDVIDRQTGAGDVVFTMPNNADLYFLSDRTNAFRFFNPTISLLDDDELVDFVADFRRVAPKLIVHDTASAYNTAMTDELRDRITADFELAATVDHFEVYARR